MLREARWSLWEGVRVTLPMLRIPRRPSLSFRTPAERGGHRLLWFGAGGWPGRGQRGMLMLMLMWSAL